MTRAEFVAQHLCCVDECGFYAKPYPVGNDDVPLCTGHGIECDNRGVTKFNARNNTDLEQIGAAMSEAYRQAYWRELQDLLEQRRG